MTEKPKLSELIRKGAAMVDGQCQGDYICDDGQDGVYCCAAGAAYYAFTGDLPRPIITYGILSTDSPIDVLANAGIHLLDYDKGIDVVEWNDAENLTFEEIALKLESLGL